MELSIGTLALLVIVAYLAFVGGKVTWDRWKDKLKAYWSYAEFLTLQRKAAKSSKQVEVKAEEVKKQNGGA